MHGHMNMYLVLQVQPRPTTYKVTGSDGCYGRYLLYVPLPYNQLAYSLVCGGRRRLPSDTC